MGPAEELTTAEPGDEPTEAAAAAAAATAAAVLDGTEYGEYRNAASGETPGFIIINSP